MSSLKQSWGQRLRWGVLVVTVLGSAQVLAVTDDGPPGDDRETRQQRWQSLPPAQRERLMERYERFRQLPPEEQEAVKRRYHKWRELPEDERRAVRDKWQQMSPDDRKAVRERFHERHGGDRVDQGDDGAPDRKGRAGKREKRPGREE
jgi:predicted Fe-S protein YdhL (DUF1289 family)